MEEIIESIGIIIRTKDKRIKEIPLEPWQTDFLGLLGLQVNLPDLDDYRMSNREVYEKQKAEYIYALRLYRKNLLKDIKSVLGANGINTRSDFYSRSDVQLAEIYKLLKPLQGEYYFAEGDLQMWVEEAVHTMEL